MSDFKAKLHHDFRWGSAPSDPLAGYKGPTSKEGREGERGLAGGGKGMKRWEEEGSGREG